MSYCNNSDKNVILQEDNSQLNLQDLSEKAYTRMDLIDKLKLINDMDNGQRKSDIAKKYGVHPHTINYIYKQKESVLRTYTQVCNIVANDVRCVNLDRSLLEWFILEIRSGKIVNEDLLRTKALEISKKSKEGVKCTDSWLLDFRTRHNIGKYVSDIECSAREKKEWTAFLYGFNIKDVYLGGVSALAHRHDFSQYASGQHADSYISLFLVINIQGTDKRELAIVGQDTLNTESHLKSLPVNYYSCNKPQVNYFVIHSCLKKWDNELIDQKRSVILFMNIPDEILQQLQFQNIRVISAAKLNYGTKILEKIIECFKFHYRKLQMHKTMTVSEVLKPQTELDYICMVSMAWWNVPCRYIQRLCCPLEDGSLYFKAHNDNDESHCLSKWYKAKIKLSKSNLASNMLDKFIFCDDHLPSIYFVSEGTTNTNEMLLRQNLQSTSGVEAYQAMKRLVSYVQGKDASSSLMKNAKLMENHIEYGALSQIHDVISSTNY